MEPVEIDFIIGGNTETEGKKVEKQIDDISSSSKRAQIETANLGKAINSTAKQTGGFNSMGAAVQQIVRETPAAAMGMNMFFLAISNNIPILRDAIARTREENELLKASGKTAVPVWKQLAGSLFSWQSLMMVGITLLSMYGKDIIDWVGKLLTGKAAIDRTSESQRALNKVFSDFTGQASKKIQDVTRIGIEIEKYGNNSKNTRKIVDDFNRTFNTHLKTIDEVKKAYPGLSKAAIEAAIKIQAANSLIEKSAQATLKKQEADTKLAAYPKSQVEKHNQMLNELFAYARKTGEDLNQTTTELLSQKQPSFLEAMYSIDTVDLTDQELKLRQFYAKDDNLWFAKYIAQQRKYGKMIGIENREIQKLLNGVDFKDFSPDPSDPKAPHDKQYYDAAKAMQKLVVDVEKETAGLLLSAQDDYLQTRLDKVTQEEKNEIASIRQRAKDIVDEYNRSHKDDKGFKPKQDLSGIDSVQAKKLEEDITAMKAAYVAKRKKIETDYFDEVTRLSEGMADARKKIELDYEDDIKTARANGAESYAQKLEAERDKKISEATAQLIQETDIYKMATDEQLAIGKNLNDKLIMQVKDRIKAEIAANKLSQADGNKILSVLDRSQAEQVSDTLGEFIEKYKKLGEAKKRLESAKSAGNIEGAAAASQEVDALTKSVEGYGQKLQSVMSKANTFAGQAIDLLNAMSTEEGDAASSAAKSIGAVMNIANSTLQGFQQGGAVGAAFSFVMSTATQIFNSEKAHRQALAELEKSRNAIQKEYNDLLMKQNKLLEAAQTIFGTNGMAQANAYAAQMESYSDALYSKESTTKNAKGIWGRMGFKETEYKGAIAALNNAKIQTGSHKTGLFGWGGEKADYSSLLSVYKDLVDSNGKLNKEMAQSILNNGKLDETSKTALQSALDYTEAYDEALKNLQGYLNSIFGDLGGELMTAITDNLNDSKKAVDDFGDYVGQAMKKMISDIAYNIFFAKMFKDLSNKVTAVYKDASLTDKQKGDAATEAVSTFYNGIGSATEGATKFINDMYSAISGKTGIDMYGKDKDNSSKGIQGDVNNMNEDTGSALVGAINAMRLNVVELLKNSNSGLETLSSILGLMAEIRDNTSFCRKLERIDETLYYMKQNGIKVL